MEVRTMGKLGDGFRKVIGAPVRALLPKNPLLRALLILIPIALVFGALAPLVDLVTRGLGMIADLIEPMLETTVGRIVLTVLFLALLTLILYRMLRGQIADMRARAALGRHLEGVASLIGAGQQKAETWLEKSARYRGPLPADYPHLVQDANLKLARLALEKQDLDRALHWLARTVERDLPKPLRRSAAQLRCRVLLEQRDVLPETAEKELRDAVKVFKDDWELHRLMRRALLRRGALGEVAEVQELVVRCAPPARSGEERQRLLLDWMAAGEAALVRGELDVARQCAKKGRAVDRDAPGPGCLLGKVQLAEGDARAAITTWGKTKSPEGLDLVAGLLQQQPGLMEPRELLERCPMQGTLLLVAREYARRGEHEMAERAARRAARVLGPTPTVTAVLGEVLGMLGKEREAELLCEKAVVRLLEG